MPPCYCINLMGAFRGTKAVWIWKDLLFYFGGSFHENGKGLSATFLFSCVHQRISGICQKRMIEVHCIANFSISYLFYCQKHSSNTILNKFWNTNREFMVTLQIKSDAGQLLQSLTLYVVTCLETWLVLILLNPRPSSVCSLYCCPAILLRINEIPPNIQIWTTVYIQLFKL